MTEAHLKNVIEAALLASGKPLQLAELAQLFEEHARPDNNAVRAALDALAADYEGRGIEVKETATGFRVQVRKELAPEISRLWPERPPRYSRALLETLALIAYRQPITRAEIEAVRGVAVNPNIIKTLLERNWVRVVGTRDVPGRPELIATTREFLDYFSLRTLDELPPLAELKTMTDPNLQLALSGAAPVAAAVVDGLLTEGTAEQAAGTELAAANGETDAPSAEVNSDEAAASEASSDASPDETADETVDDSVDELSDQSAEQSNDDSSDELLDDAIDESSDEDDDQEDSNDDSAELVAAHRNYEE